MISTIRIRGNSSSISDSISEESKEIEKKGRTAIIKNFEDGTSIDELEEKFREFGLVNKVTLMCDKLTGKPKTMAYIEFEEQDSRNCSLTLNGTFYKNNIIYVNKRNREIPITAGKKGKNY